MERARKPVLIGLAAVTLGIAATWWVGGAAAGGVERRGGLIPGDGQRLMVEVLNGTTVDGLARAVTGHLRHRGIDVVYYGSRPAPPAGSTLVIARRGDTALALAVRDVLGVGRVVDEIDSTRLLDVSVVLGRDAAGLRFNP